MASAVIFCAAVSSGSLASALGQDKDQGRQEGLRHRVLASVQEKASDAGVEVKEAVSSVRVLPSTNARLALPYYQFAAEHGDAKALLRYGLALVQFADKPSDIAAAEAAFRRSAELGNTGAMLSLADLIARRRSGDRSESIPLYERAGELGRDIAWLKLGQIYLAGRIVPSDPKKAHEYLRKAEAAGRLDAKVVLGRAFTNTLLPRYGSPKDGIDLLKEAEAKGSAEAVVVLADSLLEGRGVRRNADKAVNLLKSAWESGNLRAGRRLLALYRDGRKDQVNPNRFLAEYYFRKLSPKLSDNDRAIEQLFLDASKERGRPSLESIRVRINHLAATSRPAAVQKLRVLNARAYVYAMQWRLKELAVFSGRVSGQLNTSTVRAIYRYCISQTKPETCKKGPLTADVAEVITAEY
jgi:TPR repeat protein